MIISYVQNYELSFGLIDLGGSVALNLLRTRMPAGKIKRIDIYSAGNLVGGTAIFNLRVNGVSQFSGGARPSISNGNSVASKTGLDIAITRGSRVTLDLENNPHAQNLFPITLIVDVDDGLGAQRETVISTASIALNATANINAPFSRIAMAWQVENNRPARVRAYATDADRTADAARAIGVDAEPGIELLLETVTETGELTARQIRPAFLINGDDPATNLIYFAITNLDATGIVDTTISNLILES